MSETPNKIIVGDREYLVPEKLTLGELADVEGITGQAYDPEKSGAKMTLAIVFIAMRRADPSVTLESVRSLDYEELEVIVNEEEEGDASPPVEQPPAPEPEETPGPSGPQS